MSGFGTFRTSHSGGSMSALGGKAGIGFLTKSDFLFFRFFGFDSQLLAVLVVPCLWMLASSAMSACATMATAAIARRPVTAYISKTWRGNHVDNALRLLPVLCEQRLRPG
jgi:hypothetical protein